MLLERPAFRTAMPSISKSRCWQPIFRSVLVWNGNYELPFGKGRQFGSGMNPWLNAFAGGWQLNGIWTIHRVVSPWLSWILVRNRLPGHDRVMPGSMSMVIPAAI